jgi:hypothetical protein
VLVVVGAVGGRTLADVVGPALFAAEALGLAVAFTLGTAAIALSLAEGAT